jgi:D-glycero-D-manno-heptose 1,7-bisphosphate phosphatase
MKALILAAGVGSRLRPITDHVPKAMVPIADGLPLLEHHIRQLKSQGVRDFVINLHHLAHCITDYFRDGSRFGVRIEYSDETTGLLDTAGAVRKAAPMLGSEFLLIYADQLHFFDFGGLLALHRERGALATLVVKRSDVPQNGDMVELDTTTGRVTRWHPRPHTITSFSSEMYLNAGLYVLSSEIVQHIPAGRPVSLDREVLPAVLAQGMALYGVPTAADILDIGTPAKYEYAKEWFAAHPARENRALFLDRDGVILEALPRGEYLTDWSQSRLVDGIQNLVRTAKAAGYVTIVATNQPQVSRGLLSEDGLRAIHDSMSALLDGQLDAIYYCPHADRDACDCRKPKDGMLLRGSRELNVALDRSIFVGDSDRDVKAGRSAGCRTVFIRNQYNSSEAERCQPSHFVDTLSEVTGLL